MYTEIYLALHHCRAAEVRATELRAEADAYRLAATVRRPRGTCAPVSGGPSWKLACL
jgi:hypothetical protein